MRPSLLTYGLLAMLALGSAEASFGQISVPNLAPKVTGNVNSALHANGTLNANVRGSVSSNNPLRFHNGHWWYAMPNGSWMYHQNGRWNAFHANVNGSYSAHNRMRFYNGIWWYSTPNGGWMYHRNGRWNTFQASAGVGVGANLGLQSSNAWRYRQHGGEWWYWTPENRWTYYRGGSWQNYNPTTFVRPSLPGLGNRVLPGVNLNRAVPNAGGVLNSGGRALGGALNNAGGLGGGLLGR